MAVPDYQSFMRPLLEVTFDQNDWRTSDLKDAVADHVGLTEDDRAELLPSGKQLTYANRIGWAKTYLTKAGLLESPKRGWVRITDQGLDALNSGQEINNAFLQQFEGFQDFRARNSEEQNGTEASTEQDDITPDERLDKLYRTIRTALAQELLDMVMAANPAFFERLVVELLVAMGYGGSVTDAGRAIGRSGDNGIDGIIKQDRLGIDNVYIQAKRWSRDRTVGAGEVRDLAGALSMRRATKGVLITTSDFTQNAIDTARQVGNIVLVNGDRLAELMIDHDVGVTTAQRYELKKVDQDYFEDA
jgi:restriction system protein